MHNKINTQAKFEQSILCESIIKFNDTIEY